MLKYDLVVIGGGPAGMAAALRAKECGVKKIIILERAETLGGILEQCIHTGFGLHYFGEELSGPEYAARFIEQVNKTDIDVKVDTMVTEIRTGNIVVATNNTDGLIEISATAIVLAMGCRERPRGALDIPGSRASGIMTAGTAQKYVNIDGYMPGKKVVILGSGDIGLIMARRLTLEGAEVLGVYEINPTPSGLTRNIHQCLTDYDIPLHLSHTVTRVFGKDRLEAVEVCAVDESLKPIPETAERIECDALIVSVGLIPENELAESMGVELDSHTKGPVCDGQLMTSVPGIFSCGNALHVNDLVDYVSASGEEAGKNAALYAVRERRSVDIHIGAEFMYLVPQRLDLNADNSRLSFYFRSSSVLGKSVLRLKVDGAEVWKRGYPFLRPPEMQQLVLDMTKFGITDASDVRFEIEVAE